MSKRKWNIEEPCAPASCILHAYITGILIATGVSQAPVVSSLTHSLLLTVIVYRFLSSLLTIIRQETLFYRVIIILAMNNNWTNETNSIFPERPQHPICNLIFFSQTIQPHWLRMKNLLDQADRHSSCIHRSYSASNHRSTRYPAENC